jgi:two-component system response regulator FixJ
MPVRTYASAEAFLEAVETLAEGCVLTDVHLPAMSGLDLLRRLGNRRESFPVIVLTGQADVATAVDAIKLGAVDFIEKPFDQETLLGATRGVLRRLAAASDARRLRADYTARLATLAPREREVLEGLIAGGSNKAVAHDLGISPRTVDIHRSKIMMKMRADSFSDLIRMVVQARGA